MKIDKQMLYLSDQLFKKYEEIAFLRRMSREKTAAYKRLKQKIYGREIDLDDEYMTLSDMLGGSNA